MSGRPKGIKNRPREVSAAEWIRQLCIEDENGCLIWPRAKTNKGYGSISPGDGRAARGTHVVIFEERYGPVPKGFMVGHVCPNRKPGQEQRLCCNIDHLKLTNAKENASENVVNSRSQINASKTHCKRGHEYNEANTFEQTRVRPDGTIRVERVCRLCRNELQRAYRSKEESDVSCG